MPTRRPPVSPDRRTPITPAERAERHLIASLASNARWAKVADRTAATAPGREAFEARFVREVDPEGVLPVDVRAGMVANARRAYFQRIALKSLQSRRQRAAQAPEADLGGDAA